MRGLFFRDGRLVLPLRIFLYLVLFELAQLASHFLAVGRDVGEVRLVVSTLLEAAVRGGGVVGVTLFARRFLDRAAFSPLGLDSPRKRLGAIALGFLAGGALIGLVFGVELAAGFARVVGTESSATRAAAVLVALFVKYAAVGVAEEVALRGYVYVNLAERGPAWRAALVTGILFGLLHGALSGFGPLFMVSMLLFTALLVVTRNVSGSLWFAIAFHAAWDWVQDAVLGLSNVGAADFDHALIHVEQRGPKLLVGTPPAIEGGLLFVGALAIAFAAALLWARGRIEWGARKGLRS